MLFARVLTTGTCRTMSAAVEDGAVQCAAGIEEQGCDQVFWEVLS